MSVAQPLTLCLLHRSPPYLRSAAEGAGGLLRLDTLLAKAEICQDHVSLWVRNDRKGLMVRAQMPHPRAVAVEYGKETQATCFTQIQGSGPG